MIHGTRLYGYSILPGMARDRLFSDVPHCRHVSVTYRASNIRVLATEIRPTERCTHIAKNVNPPLTGSDFSCQHCMNINMFFDFDSRLQGEDA